MYNGQRAQVAVIMVLDWHDVVSRLLAVLLLYLVLNEQIWAHPIPLLCAMPCMLWCTNLSGKEEHINHALCP